MLIEVIIVCGIACAYLVKFFLLEEKISHEGPFPSKSETVVFPERWEDGVLEAEHTQRVALQDRIRRLFGVYKVKDELWTVFYPRAELWTCPFCLSFWISIPFTIFFAYFFQDLSQFIPIFHFSVASIAVFVVKRCL